MPTTSTKQTFAFSHSGEKDFKEGLRSYAEYRDFGFAAATNGKAVAHVIRFVRPCNHEARAWHRHDVEFQMVYVLKGWIVTEMEGYPPEKMVAGSSWMQPPGIRHRVVDYSVGCEALEIVLPADFETHAEDKDGTQ